MKQIFTNGVSMAMSFLAKLTSKKLRKYAEAFKNKRFLARLEKLLTLIK